MPTLAFDCCLGAVSVALRRSTEDKMARTCGKFELCRAGHAERLLPMIDAVLQEARIEASQLGRVAVTLGPGTFTGVRTGISVARALALATGAPVVGTSSLHVMALGRLNSAMAATFIAVTPPSAIAVMVDARKGEVFAQLFAADATPRSEPELLTVAEVTARLSGVTWHIVGSAAEAVAVAARASGIAVSSVEPCEPDARELIKITPTLTPLATVTPLYIRPPDAVPRADKSLPRAGP